MSYEIKHSTKFSHLIFPEPHPTKMMQRTFPRLTRIICFDGITSIDLPAPEGPVGPSPDNIDTYKKAIYNPNSKSLFTSTHVGVFLPTGEKLTGQVGTSPNLISPPQAKLLARNSGLRLLSTIHNYLDGDLTRVAQITKLTGFVNTEEGFGGLGEVMNGCSELLIEVFGPHVGVGVRQSSGASSLAGNSAVSIDIELQLR